MSTPVFWTPCANPRKHYRLGRGCLRSIRNWSERTIESPVCLSTRTRLLRLLKAAEAGIQAAPQSASLYLAKAEILEKQNRYYDARRTLREVAPKLPDPELIERLAEMEDAGGEHAAKYYRQLVEAGEKGSATAAERSNALDRGLRTALRDGDLEEAAWFRSRQAADTLGARSARAGPHLAAVGYRSGRTRYQFRDATAAHVQHTSATTSKVLNDNYGIKRLM